SRSRLEETPVGVCHVPSTRPAAQKRLMRQTNNRLAFSVFIADKKPGCDQCVDKGGFLSCVRNLGKHGWPYRYRLIAKPNRCQGAQHRWQCILHIGWERVDDLIGSPRNRTFEAAQSPISGKGEEPAPASGLVKRIEHEFEQRE